MDPNIDRTNTPAVVLPPALDPTGAMEGSEFLASVLEQFFNPDGSSSWPGLPADTQAVRARAEIPAALDALFRRVGSDDDLPEAEPATALGKLKAAADAVDWPDAAKIPDAWPTDEEETYRYYEVACAVNLMIRAFCGRGGGGGPREYPPPPNSN